MKDRVVLITGGSRGIGAETAILAAEKGWDVVISYRNQDEKAQAIVKQIEALGQKALAVKSDVAVEAEVIALFETVDREFGRLDALVNNAGVLETACKVIDMSVARLQRVLTVNIVGSFMCAQQAIKRMSTISGGEGGSIVNLSSAAARLGSANEFVDYAASKGAIDTFTIGLSKEIGSEGIRVNAVRPGLIVTDIHADSGDANRPERLAGGVPMGRSGSAREVATSIVWLMSEEASYVNGALVDVTGGR